MFLYIVYKAIVRISRYLDGKLLGFIVIQQNKDFINFASNVSEHASSLNEVLLH